MQRRGGGGGGGGRVSRYLAIENLVPGGRVGLEALLEQDFVALDRVWEFD